MIGDPLTRWPARVAMTLYALGLALRANGRPLAARLAWTAGVLALLVHVVAAFHFFHGWSHAAAYEATARRTADAVGLAWGGGLYANYLFVPAWAADAAWWWLAPATYRARPAWVEAAVQVFLAFIAFNAAVVFVEGPARWVALVVCGLLIVALARGVTKRYNRPATRVV